jgi:uncharacterized membrane protein HdeD (DUF308 family)
MMVTEFVQNWWMLAMRGIAAILFGIGSILWPGITLAVLVFMFGAYALVDGIFALITGIRVRRWEMVIVGIAGILTGVLTFVWPGVTALALLYFIAVWSLITGVFEISMAIQLRKIIDNEWTLILTALLSIVFGVTLIVFPGAGALSVLWLIGWYALIAGILTLVFSFRLRGVHKRMSGRVAGTV